MCGRRPHRRQFVGLNDSNGIRIEHSNSVQRSVKNRIPRGGGSQHTPPKNRPILYLTEILTAAACNRSTRGGGGGDAERPGRGVNQRKPWQRVACTFWWLYFASAHVSSRAAVVLQTFRHAFEVLQAPASSPSTQARSMTTSHSGQLPPLPQPSPSFLHCMCVLPVRARVLPVRVWYTPNLINQLRGEVV